MSDLMTPGRSDAATANRIEIVPLTGAIGAEVRGVRLSGELDKGLVSKIRAALLEHKVIFFRGQHHLDDAGQEAFAARFGELKRHPVADAAEGSSALLELTEGYSASTWHTDVTFTPQPPAFAVLRGLAMPAVGGDTMWANAARAYTLLPEPLRLLAENLWAIHSLDFDFEGAFSEAYRAKMPNYAGNTRKVFIETEHPVVHVHPETGERSLLLGSWLKRFVGLTTSESHKIFEILQAYVCQPENTVRWKWSEGDVAMWDNRATQHRAVPDYGDAVRILRRAAVEGAVPVAMDGRQSRARTAPGGGCGLTGRGCLHDRPIAAR